jgi:hypothetical protein
MQLSGNKELAQELAGEREERKRERKGWEAERTHSLEQIRKLQAELRKLLSQARQPAAKYAALSY